jgi:microcystin-dependent protein
MNKSKNKLKSSSSVSLYEPKVFDINYQNITGTINVDQISQKGWDPTDETRYLEANDLNYFMYRTNFTGDLKNVLLVNSGDSFEPVGNDIYYLYNINPPTNGFIFELDAPNFPPGFTTKLVNSSTVNSVYVGFVSGGAKPFFLYPGYYCEITFVTNSDTSPLTIVKTFPPENVPHAITGQIICYPTVNAPPGFLLCRRGSIGRSGSVATILASEEAKNLFFFLWLNFDEIWCPVYGGKGATPDEDYNAGKIISLPYFDGKAIVHTSNGNYVNAQYFGSDNVLLTTETIPSHKHISPAQMDENLSPRGAYGIADSTTQNYKNTAGDYASYGLGYTSSEGGGLPHENRQPSIAFNHYIKL